MSVSESVRIFICFVAAGICCECVCQKGRSFSDILPEVYRIFRHEIQDLYLLDENSLIYEKNSGILCDPHVSLSSLGVRAGMIFQIF